jgi:hypothetical protein
MSRPTTSGSARELGSQPDAERQRVLDQRERATPWWRWGPYLSERQWSTVREDYSADGSAWDSFPHDQARSRAYRWGEDGLLGISDNHGRLCFGLALWNEQDPILKERLFGLTGNEGNHAEDVKEYYFYLDSTPTHSYMRALYKYPQSAFPYAELVAENARRGKDQLEFQLVDTGIFAEDRYFDVQIEYAKASPTDLIVRITATNHGPDAAPLQLLPTLWFRNTWSWDTSSTRPILCQGGPGIIEARHDDLGVYTLACNAAPALLFTENDTNAERLWGGANETPHVKDAFHDAVVHGRTEAVNPANVGTKAAAHYRLQLQPGETRSVLLRLSDTAMREPFADAEQGIRRRESTGARLGGLARLQDRQTSLRQGRPPVSGARLPEAVAQLHVVGEP